MEPDICIYHSPCQDGFTSAWAIWKCWPDVEFVPGVYGQEPPDVTGKDVLIVDFSYKRAVLEAMGRTAKSITVLDHHKSAQEDLAPWAVHHNLMWPAQLRGADRSLGVPIQALFDMEKSGAMLAWEYAHRSPPPRLVQHVQDRDLWKFELDGTREIAADLFSWPYDFDTWSAQAAMLENDELREVVIQRGQAIERKHHKDVAELLQMTVRSMIIGGREVRVANLPYTMASDGGNELAEWNRYEFGATYYDDKDGNRVFSLRSTPDGLDVSAIAVQYGGGGHARAAGFRRPKGWEGDV